MKPETTIYTSDRESDTFAHCMTIRLLDLPRFRALEDRLLIYGQDGQFETMCAETLTYYFGAAFFSDTVLRAVPGADPDVLYEIEFDYEYDEDVEPDADTLPELVSATGAEEDIVAHMLTLGFDFRDEYGRPSRLTKSVAPSIEAALSGMRGFHLPDREGMAAEAFEASLQQRNWKAPSAEPKPGNGVEAKAAAEALFKKR